MKENRTMIATTGHTVARRALDGNGGESRSSSVPATQRARHQTSDLILFLLDVARGRVRPDFLSLAKDVASQLACEWRDFSGDERPHSVTVSFKGDLSNSAFALAEIWKVTREPVYREAGLDILRYLREI